MKSLIQKESAEKRGKPSQRRRENAEAGKRVRRRATSSYRAGLKGATAAGAMDAETAEFMAAIEVDPWEATEMSLPARADIETLKAIRGYA